MIVLFLVLLAPPSSYLFYVYSLLLLLDRGRDTLLDLLSRPLTVIHALLLHSYRLNGLLDHLRDEVTLIIIFRQVYIFPILLIHFFLLHVIIFHFLLIFLGLL